MKFHKRLLDESVRPIKRGLEISGQNVRAAKGLLTAEALEIRRVEKPPNGVYSREGYIGRMRRSARFLICGLGGWLTCSGANAATPSLDSSGKTYGTIAQRNLFGLFL